MERDVICMLQKHGLLNSHKKQDLSASFIAPIDPWIVVLWFELVLFTIDTLSFAYRLGFLFFIWMLFMMNYFRLKIKREH